MDDIIDIKYIKWITLQVIFYIIRLDLFRFMRSRKISKRVHTAHIHCISL